MLPDGVHTVESLVLTGLETDPGQSVWPAQTNLNGKKSPFCFRNFAMKSAELDAVKKAVCDDPFWRHHFDSDVSVHVAIFKKAISPGSA